MGCLLGIFKLVFSLFISPFLPLAEKLEIIKAQEIKSIDDDRSFRSNEDNNCSECQELFHEKFISYSEYDSFEILLKNSKLKQVGSIDSYNQPKYRVFGVGHGGEYFIGASIYSCPSCNELWELSSPDQAWRGYFKRIVINNEQSKYIKFREFDV